MKLALAAVVLALSGVCLGVPVDMTLLQPYSLYAHAMFLNEDLNSDGILTRTELETIFDRYDANGDGVESRKEYTEYICATGPELYMISHYLYDAWDFDNDHHLRANDYDALFSAMDTNGDDQVVDQEFIDYFVALFTSIEGQGNHQHGNSFEHGAHACHV